MHTASLSTKMARMDLALRKIEERSCWKWGTMHALKVSSEATQTVFQFKWEEMGRNGTKWEEIKQKTDTNSNYELIPTRKCE